MTRRDTNGTINKTGAVVITLNTEELPERLTMCGVSYRIRQYFQSPLICGKCLKIGHIKTKCQAEHETCRLCGGLKEAMHECMPDPICPNCPTDDNKHKPNSKECKRMEYEREVIKYKTLNRTSIFEAKEAIKNYYEKTSHKWRPDIETTQSQNNLDSNNSCEIDDQIIQASVTLNTLDEKIAKYRALTQQINERQKELQQVISEYEAAKQKEKDTLERISRQNKTHNTRSGNLRKDRSRSSEPKLKIAKHAAQAPQDSEMIQSPKLEQMIELMSQDQKNKYRSVNDKAMKTNNATVSWYLKDNQLIPVEIPNVASPSPNTKSVNL